MKKKIFSLIVLPVMVLGLIVIMIALTVVKGSLVSETEEALKSAATATLAAYDQNQGDYLEAENGDIWKGSYNVSKSESIVDSIKEKAGVDVTFFYGDKRELFFIGNDKATTTDRIDISYNTSFAVDIFDFADSFYAHIIINHLCYLTIYKILGEKSNDFSPKVKYN